MRKIFNPLILLITLTMLWMNGYSTESAEPTASFQHASTPKEADGFLIVDCLLPETEHSSRRPIKISAWECELYDGYYLAYDYSGYYYTDHTTDYYYTDYSTAL
jgi:hypothetical protein